MRVFITGINGYLGSCLATALAAAGHEVHGSQRQPKDAPRIFVMRLNQPFDAELLRAIDVVVHCAHDFGPDAARVNVAGTQSFFDAARAAAVPRQLYVSSYSARPDALSVYGRIKHELETWFLARGETVVRPGLVVGHGGLFARNMRKILNTPILPLLRGGRDLLPVIGERDLVACVLRILSLAPPSAYNLFNRRLVPMRELVDCLNRLAHHRAVVLPVPLALATASLRVLSALGVALPVGLDNLRALQQNQRAFHESHLLTLLERETTLEEMLDAALRSYRGAAA